MPLHLNNYRLILAYPVTLHLGRTIACKDLLMREAVTMSLVLVLGIYLAPRVLEVLYYYHIASKLTLYY